MKRIKDMETIYLKQVIKDKACEVLTHYEVILHNGKKFLIFITAKNSYPCGFNTNCCIKIMNNSGGWENLVDNEMLGFSSLNDDLYYSNNAEIKKRAVETNVEKFKDYIAKVY